MTLSLKHFLIVNDLCDRFEAAGNSGLRPSIEDYLDRISSPLRPTLLYALFVLELELAASDGERPDIRAYAARFPEHVAVIERAIRKCEEDRINAAAQDTESFGSGASVSAGR